MARKDSIDQESAGIECTARLSHQHGLFQVHRMKAFSFIRSSLAGGCYQGPPAKPEESPSGVIPKVPSLLFDLEVSGCTSSKA